MRLASEDPTIQFYVMPQLISDNNSRIDFPNPPNEELHDLLEYCRPAVGSRDSQCTLPASQFLTSFDPDRCGLIEQQAAHLLSERWPGGVSRGFYSLCERLDIYGVFTTRLIYLWQPTHDVRNRSGGGRQAADAVWGQKW